MKTGKTKRGKNALQVKFVTYINSASLLLGRMFIKFLRSSTSKLHLSKASADFFRLCFKYIRVWNIIYCCISSTIYPLSVLYCVCVWKTYYYRYHNFNKFCPLISWICCSFFSQQNLVSITMDMFSLSNYGFVL